MSEIEKEKKNPNFNKGKKKKFGKFDAAKALNTHLHGDLVDDFHTFDTRKSPARVSVSLVRDKNNPKSWYIKYVNVTPAVNYNRPMEPIFNVAFSKNGTSGVPKFIELDVEWKGFADTFMMDQISYTAMQQIRKALKSNLTYSDAMIKVCIVNGLVLLVFGKMLERDIHWNLYNGSSDFNFAEMYKQQNQVVNTYGIVPLYPRSELLDANLPYTSTVYNKVVSLFNQVIRLPKNVSEFCSHYFGSLFTLDKDGHNDQYLKINMHEMDWFENNDPTKPSSIDVSSISIDDYLTMLNNYSKDFAVLLADLEKCLGVNAVKLSRYDEYTYAFIFDKSLLQALINGYTDDSAVANDFVRLDKMSGVEDDLTQFLFLGGIQGATSSKADVRAIRILDMVLKCNSDSNIDWPKLLDQFPFRDVDNAAITMNEPFGLSIVTKMNIDDVIEVSSSEASQATTLPIPSYPHYEPGNAGNTGFVWQFGSTSNTKYPATNYTKATDAAFRSLNYFGAFIYLGAVEFDESTDHYGRFFFATRYVDYNDIPLGGANFAFNSIFYLQCKGTHNQIRNTEQGISRDPRASVWFCDLLKTDVNGSLANHMNQNFSITANGVVITSYGAITPTLFPLEANLYLHCYKNLADGDVYGAYMKTGAISFLTWSWGLSDTRQYALVSDQQAAPNGLIVGRNYTVLTTLIASDIDMQCVAYGEGLPMYVTQVIDYHIPLYYNRRITVTVNVNGNLSYEGSQTSLPVLVKEDYIPYYYNRLDLIPVLYEMFVSLFSIDSVRKNNTFK